MPAYDQLIALEIERDEILEDAAHLLKAAVAMYRALRTAGTIPKWYQSKGEYWYDKYATPALEEYLSLAGWAKRNDTWSPGQTRDRTARIRESMCDLFPEMATLPHSAPDSP
jgi:hypothetical protein